MRRTIRPAHVGASPQSVELTREAELRNAPAPAELFAFELFHQAQEIVDIIVRPRFRHCHHTGVSGSRRSDPPLSAAQDEFFQDIETNLRAELNPLLKFRQEVEALASQVAEVLVFANWGKQIDFSLERYRCDNRSVDVRVDHRCARCPRGSGEAGRRARAAR